MANADVFENNPNGIAEPFYPGLDNSISVVEPANPGNPASVQFGPLTYTNDLVVVVVGLISTTSLKTVSSVYWDGTACSYRTSKTSSWKSGVYYYMDLEEWYVQNTQVNGYHYIYVTLTAIPDCLYQIEAFAMYNQSGNQALYNIWDGGTDGTAGTSSGNGANPSTTTSEQTNDNDLVFGMALDFSNTPSAGSGYTSIQSTGGMCSEFKNVFSTSSSYTVGFTASSTHWIALGDIFYGAYLQPYHEWLGADVQSLNTVQEAVTVYQATFPNKPTTIEWSAIAIAGSTNSVAEMGIGDSTYGPFLYITANDGGTLTTYLTSAAAGTTYTLSVQYLNYNYEWDFSVNGVSWETVPFTHSKLSSGIAVSSFEMDGNMTGQAQEVYISVQNLEDGIGGLSNNGWSNWACESWYVSTWNVQYQTDQLSNTPVTGWFFCSSWNQNIDIGAQGTGWPPGNEWSSLWLDATPTLVNTIPAKLAYDEESTGTDTASYTSSTFTPMYIGFVFSWVSQNGGIYPITDSPGGSYFRSDMVSPGRQTIDDYEPILYNINSPDSQSSILIQCYYQYYGQQGWTLLDTWTSPAFSGSSALVTSMQYGIQWQVQTLSSYSGGQTTTFLFYGSGYSTYVQPYWHA